jgi:uncharacterized membrane protein YgaE (UPF0421/DUF939 family)
MATTAAMLASYFSVLWLEHIAGLRVDVVVLAVFLAVSLGHVHGRADPLDRAIGLVLFPVAMVGAGEVGVLMAGDNVVAGSALFVVAVSATVWVRRFGPRFTQAGAVVTVPLLATLVLPAVPARTPGPWPALVAVIVYVWVTVAHLGAKPVAAQASRVSTRMAAQMGVGLAAAFVAGHVVLAEHWPWVVLTAFIVCSGNRGRGDVVHKSALRVAGAVVGTAAATGLTGVLGTHGQVVAIFVLLAAGTWLRPFGYAYWAACVTAALAFLYGYFGQVGPDLLLNRLGGIVVGGVIGVVASWFVLPVRSTDVARRRVADALAALTDTLVALRRGTDDVDHHRVRFEHAVGQIDQIARPLELHRRLSRAATHPADAFGVLRRCVAPLRTITRRGADVAAVLSAVVAYRRTMAERVPTPCPDLDRQLTSLAETGNEET